MNQTHPSANGRSRLIPLGIGGMFCAIAIVVALDSRKASPDNPAGGARGIATAAGDSRHPDPELLDAWGRRWSTREKFASSGKTAVTDGTDIAGITLGTSTGRDVEDRFGPPDEVKVHGGGYSSEMVYAHRGLSFYYRGESAGSPIFSIRASSPFKLRTDAGITLGKSTMADVLKSYGKLDWSTTKDSDYWWSEHDGVRYSVLRDKSVPQFPLNEELYLNHPIIEIGLIDRH